MATYFLRVKTFSRGRGARVTRAVAYRAGERIVDERSGETCDYSDRNDVAHKEIVLPSQLAGCADMDWARDRSTLWNAAEHAGRARNSRVGREVYVILPHELTPGQRIALVRKFSQELADKYQSAVDIAIHLPRSGSDERHHHAHVVMTTREVTPRGLGARTTLELGGRERHARGLGPSKADYLLLRERWAQVTNEALREAGVEARIDHRSLKEQGIDRATKPAIPLSVHYAERRLGRSTPSGDAIRARHRERVEAEARGADELARVLRRHKEEDRERAIAWYKQREGLSKKIPRSSLTREERNQRAREWRKLNRERVNQTRRERYKENPEVILQQGRAWRQANAEKHRERARKYYRLNADRLNLQSRIRRERQRTAEEPAKKWLKVRESQKEVASAEELARTWRESGASQKEAAGAEDSARRWLEFSESQKEAAGAEEPARQWLEFSERQKANPSQTAGEFSHDRPFSGNADNDDEDEESRKADRSRDDDLGL
jgi:hypothetical protein